MSSEDWFLRAGSRRASSLVSTSGFAEMCDARPSRIVSDCALLRVEDYASIAPYSLVYVVTAALPAFMREVYPRLLLARTPFTLITGHSDLGAPREASRVLFEGGDLAAQLAADGIVVAWCAQNCDGHEPLMRAIPIGLDFHTDSRPASDQEAELRSVARQAAPFQDRLPRTFSFFHFKLYDRHGRDRQRALAALESTEYNDFAQGRQDRVETWKSMARYKYVLSPHGNGLDCHRTYEAVALGCVAVVKTSSLDHIFKRLPVVILKDWSELQHGTQHLDALAASLHHQPGAACLEEGLSMTAWNRICCGHEP